MFVFATTMVFGLTATIDQLNPVASLQEPESDRAYIFEYDPRFAHFGESFVKYDFNDPEKVPDNLKGAVRPKRCEHQVCCART